MENRPDPLNRFKLAAKKAVVQEKKINTEKNGPVKNEKSIQVLANTFCLEKTKQKPPNRYFAQFKRVWSAMRRFYRNSGLKHLALISVVVAYSCFGGWLFSKLELENEKLLKSQKNTTAQDEALNLTGKIVEFLNSREKTGLPLNESIFRLIKNYQHVKKMYADDKITWDFWGGMFFAGTVYTTIGYGHYAPVTDEGRVAVVVYALLGIPMLLALLADLGKLLTGFLNAVWTRFRQTLAYVMTKVSRKQKYEPALQVARNSDFDFPIPIALGFIAAWILCCSALFCLWETSWRYFDAFYFFVISLSTIGLGDITPNHPKYMICNFPLVIVGLTLVTLVINLIQNKIEKIKERATELLEWQLGLDEEEDEDEEEEPDQGRKQAEAQRTTLGVIQTLRQRTISKRRRVGVQTDESWPPAGKDLNHNDASPNLLLPEAGSRDTLYFDAP